MFSRLASLYGASFGRQWDGTNIDEVKSTWAEKLGGFTSGNIASALKDCDDRQYPPNLPQFLELCRDAARREVLRFESLPAPAADPKIIRQATKAIERRNFDPHGWAKELRERYQAGEILYSRQIEMASEVLGEVWAKGKCERVSHENV